MHVGSLWVRTASAFYFTLISCSCRKLKLYYVSSYSGPPTNQCKGKQLIGIFVSTVGLYGRKAEVNLTADYLRN